MKVSRWTVSSIVCAALLVVSLYGCYSFVSMPSLRSKNNLDLSYVQSTEYVYTAHVKPSLLYDNRTEIHEGEPLYLKLVDRLDVTLTYNLAQTPKTFDMADIKLSYETSGTLSGGDWSKNYALKPKVTTDARFSDTYTLEMKEIQGIVEAIGKETGTGTYTYTYEIRPLISLEALTGGKPIVEEFTPTLTIKFESGMIKFEGLSSTKAGSVTHSETEAATWSLLGFSAEVEAMKTTSIIASIPLVVLLAVSMRFTLQERASRPFMERLSGDIREKIIEASEPPEHIERATIRVVSLEDLARVAEEAFKPIIHHGSVFHVLDGDLRYEFKLQEAVETPEAEEEKVEGGEEPRLKRVECPVDTEGKKCGVVAFGPTEAEAYRKLEAHITKTHPDKLNEFRMAAEGDVEEK